MTYAHRTAAEPLPEIDYDYADAFEIALPQADTRSPESLVKAAFDGTDWMPLVMVVHRRVLRFRLGPRSSPDHIFGWRVAARESDAIRLEAYGPLIRGIIIARRDLTSTAVLTTYVTYVRRGPARVIWTLVGPLHRGIAPRLLERAARRRAALGVAT
jgi:hypothetical protein